MRQTGARAQRMSVFDVCPAIRMKFSRLLYLPLLICFSVNAASGEAQQTFQLSSKVYVADFSRGTFPGAEHRSTNVFCMRLPRDPRVKEIDLSFYNKRIYFSRIVYRDPTALYVVTSPIPAGRSDEEELASMAINNQIGVNAYPDSYKQFRSAGLLGPSLVMVVRNSREGDKDAPFPLMLHTLDLPKDQLVSLSIHHFFVRGGHRIELAGLRYFDEPMGADREAEAVAEFSVFVEGATQALQSCTAKLPLRGR